MYRDVIMRYYYIKFHEKRKNGVQIHLFINTSGEPEGFESSNDSLSFSSKKEASDWIEKNGEIVKTNKNEWLIEEDDYMRQTLSIY
jgi:hypothetical protein